jgi:hypothetical protein
LVEYKERRNPAVKVALSIDEAFIKIEELVEACLKQTCNAEIENVD